MALTPTSGALASCSSTTQAAARLTAEVLSGERDLLKIIRRNLPEGSIATVEFLVTTDREKGGARVGTRMFLAASTALTRTATGLGVVTTIGEYVEGSYRTPADETRLLDGPASRELSLTPAEITRDASIALERYPLIRIESLRFWNAPEETPQAFAIAEAVARIFNQGIPLPRDSRLLSVDMRVMCHRPDLGLQWLRTDWFIDGEERGESWDLRAVRETPISTGRPLFFPQEELDHPSLDDVRTFGCHWILHSMKRAVKAAMGIEGSSLLPFGAEPMSVLTSAPRLLSTPAIEDR